MLVSDNPSGKSWQNKALKFYPKADYERMGSSVWKVHLTELWGKKQQSSRVALWLLICVVQQILLTQSTRSTLNLLHNISQLFPNCQQTSHLRSSWSVWSPKSQKMMCSMRFCITISNITFPTAVNYWWTERMHFLNKFWLQFCAHIWESWKVNFLFCDSWNQKFTITTSWQDPRLSKSKRNPTQNLGSGCEKWDSD